MSTRSFDVLFIDFYGTLAAGDVEAIDAATDRGLKRIVERAGLDWSGAQKALYRTEWRDWVGRHRDEMTAEGLWAGDRTDSGLSAGKP